MGVTVSCVKRPAAHTLAAKLRARERQDASRSQADIQNQFFVCACSCACGKYSKPALPVTLKISTRPTNLLAISALGRQTCRLSQAKLGLKNWASVTKMHEENKIAPAASSHTELRSGRQVCRLA
jgi:hypothetical protein